MMNMNDAMTVRQKLLTGFGLVLLLQLLMAVFAMNKMSAVQQNLENILDARYSKIVLVNGVIKTSLENTRLIRDILLASESTGRETVIGQMAANRKKNTDTLNTLGASLNLVKGKALFADIVTAHDQLLSHYDRFNALVQAGQMVDAARFLREQIVPDNRLLMARLDTMAAFQESLMAGARAEADASYGQARIVMAVLSALGLTLGAAVALLLSVRIGRSLGRAVVTANRIADGDLAATGGHAVHAGRDEVSQLLAALETMRARLSAALHDIRHNAGAVADSAARLSGMSGQVAASAQRQADSTSSTAATLEQLTVSISHVADSAGEASRQASQAGRLAEQGGSDALASAERMRTVSGSVQDTAGEMDSLTGEVQAIGNIVTVIRDVADQTNLLALNAAIEAARAGEAGRGFAVVADEVRKLAERTTLSAQEITRMIASIQQNAGRVVDSMAQSRQHVAAVTESAGKSGEAMVQVRDSTSEVLAAISSINHALDEQRGASQGLARSMEQVAQMAGENSATVEELARTSDGLRGLSQGLQGVVARFRL